MVYVDDFEAPFRRMKMCHMIADNKEELLAMADKIGVNRKWIQDEDTHLEHFDICLSMKKRAVAFGAKEIPFRELVEMSMNREMSNGIISHLEIIICPECRAEEKAQVEHTFPWYSYVHTCSNCGYIIMESEWEVKK